MTCTCEDRGAIIVLHKSAGTDHIELNCVKKCANNVCNKDIKIWLNFYPFCSEYVRHKICTIFLIPTHCARSFICRKVAAKVR